jgi:glycosyltransferase involved in cell wall biosynthesis
LRIVIFSHFEVYPPNHGAARRIWGLATGLSSLGNHVTILCNSITKKVETRSGVEIRLLKESSLFPFLRNPRRVINQNNPRMVSEFFSIEREDPVDVVQCEFPYLFPIASLTKILRKPIVLDEHGIERIFYETVPLPYPFEKVPVGLVGLVENFATKHSDMVFTCSSVDANKLRHLYELPPEKVHVVPNGVDQSFFEDVYSYDYGTPTVLFVGSVIHPPNVFAIRKLYHDIIPRVTKSRNKVLFAFVGKNPPTWLAASEHVTILGEVNDVRPYIAGANVCVAPIDYGSGTRTKILEFMACSKPVISTTKGVEGIEGLFDGENIVIRDSVAGFSEAILNLLSDEGEARRIGKNAEATAREMYDWRKISAKAITYYQKLM